MQKIWIILKSEFWRRVWTKKFVLITLLAPFGVLAYIGLMGAVGFFVAQSATGDEGDKAPEDARDTIAVIDATERLLPALRAASAGTVQVVAPGAPADSLRKAVRAGRYEGLLVLPEGLITTSAQAIYYTTGDGARALETALTRAATRRDSAGAHPAVAQIDSLLTAGAAEMPPVLLRALETAVRRERLAAQGVPPETLQQLQAAVPVQVTTLAPQESDGETLLSGAAPAVVGWIMGFAIFFCLLIYGTQVMQGVMEEKRNRVVEVIVSSVRPFQLMMGKVLGIGAMGLVQLTIWASFLGLGAFIAGRAASVFIDLGALNLPAFSPMLFVWFLLFFIGGYLLYASLFAAVGSTVEHQQDAQTLNLIVMGPLLVPMMSIGFVVGAPNSAFSVIMSLIPLFSPVLMPVRLAVSGALFLQALLAFVLLAATFVGAVWLSARIYRVGILMYGKKPSLAELIRWVRYR